MNGLSLIILACLALAAKKISNIISANEKKEQKKIVQGRLIIGF